ncbi:MAG: sigma-70 family RNA polymerase sigma factor [Woeseiaceae bacterium]|nr:sigma-70 family RNA polymerase sigma factor [Woeseiaceae bacterium]
MTETRLTSPSLGTATAGKCTKIPTGLCKRGGLAYPPSMARTEDSALMLRYAQDGDVEAFETLYRRHKDPVFRYLKRHCRHTETAEDLFQEVWGKIIRSRENYRPTAKFTTFLYRVAHNCFIDFLRRNKRHEGGVEFNEQLHEADGRSLDDEAERNLARRRLEKALVDLPDEQRDTFLLYEECGLSLDEIASVTESNREAVKSRLRYANQKLKAAIGVKERTS